jgi:hypothetical protein
LHVEPEAQATEQPVPVPEQPPVNWQLAPAAHTQVVPVQAVLSPPPQPAARHTISIQVVVSN